MGAVTPQSSIEQRGSCCWSCWAGVSTERWLAKPSRTDGRCMACSPPLVARPKFIAERAFEIKNWAPSTQPKMVQLKRVSTAENTSGISFYAEATNAFPIMKLFLQQPSWEPI